MLCTDWKRCSSAFVHRGRVYETPLRFTCRWCIHIWNLKLQLFSQKKLFLFGNSFVLDEKTKREVFERNDACCKRREKNVILRISGNEGYDFGVDTVVFAQRRSIEATFRVVRGRAE